MSLLMKVDFPTLLCPCRFVREEGGREEGERREREEGEGGEWEEEEGRFSGVALSLWFLSGRREE
jgi:hypothetical protein